MTILALIVCLGIIIFVHELGHFLAARAVGIHVSRFSIGFGPRVWSFTKGPTEYTLCAIPLGGFVKMKGMGDEASDKLEGDAGEQRGLTEDVGNNEGEPEVAGDQGASRHDPDSYAAKSIPARAFVIVAGVAMNMVLAVVIYAVVAGAWGEEVPETTRVGYVDSQELPEEASGFEDLPMGAEIVTIDGDSVDHWLDVQRGLIQAPPGEKITVEFVEPNGAVDITAPETGEARRAMVRAVNFWLDPKIQLVLPGEPGEAAGLEDGDRFVSVAGHEVRVWEEATRILRAHPGETVAVEVERDGDVLEKEVTPKSREVGASGGAVVAEGEIGVHGIIPPTTTVPIPRRDAAMTGVEQTVAMTGMILGFLRDLVTGEYSPRTLGGIGTIGEAVGQAADVGVHRYLHFIALLSINVAILNLLPIPILDGGHLAFLALEGIRGRSVTRRTQMRWNYVGLAFLLALMVFAHVNDVVRLLL